MSPASIVLFSLAAVGLLVTALGLTSLWRLRARRLPRGPNTLAISIIKPLCGLDDELEQNLQTHLELDYPGEWEIVLGLRSEQDPAYPLARDFAQRHSERVRLVLQQGEPGYNPKVNQLLTLTREARFPVIALTDSNVRVPRNFLSEISDALQMPNIAIATHMFVGVGERGLGAILDNLTLAGFAGPHLASSTLLLKLDYVVGKSMAMRKDALAQVGGWNSVKDKLAEDQQLSSAFRALGLHAVVCPSPVQNVQIGQPLGAFWKRQTRWLMIRYRTFFPGVLSEPLGLPSLLGLAAAILSPGVGLAWTLWGVASLGMMALTQVSAKLLRGKGFRLQYLFLTPLREALFLAAWMRGFTLKRVNWRGNELNVLQETRLAPPEVVARARNIQRLGRG